MHHLSKLKRRLRVMILMKRWIRSTKLYLKFCKQMVEATKIYLQMVKINLMFKRKYLMTKILMTIRRGECQLLINHFYNSKLLSV